MVTEIIQNRCSEATDNIQPVEGKKYGRPLVEKVLNDQKEFEDGYTNGVCTVEYLRKKFKLARALIEDGRYPKQKFLLDEFIPKAAQIDTEASEIVEQLRGELTVLLIKSGVISIKDKEAEAGEKIIADKFEQDQAMNELTKAGVPVEVLAQIITLEECADLTDEKKLEEFRSWTIHTILRPYIGKLSGTRPDRELSVVDIADRIPQQVFSHPYAVKYNLLANYFAGQMRHYINDLGAEGAMQKIEEAIGEVQDPERKKFLESVYEDIYDDITFPYKGDFNTTIQVKGKDRVFPCAEQATFCRNGARYNSRLCVADPGLGKTNTAFLYMENTDAENVLIIAPAQVRPVWQEQDNVAFKHPGNVFLIEGSDDIDAALAFPNKYVAVSKELLGRSNSIPELLPRLLDLAVQRRMDGTAIDEIHNFTNPRAASTRALRKLLEVINHNYQIKTGKSNAPIIGLTATPLRKNIADLNIPMAMLYPDEFAATPVEATETKKTFSDRCLRNPHLTYLALTGERRMFRWESGSREFDCDTLSVQASPFENLLADFINREIGGDALNKIRLVENAYFNPLLVKKEVAHLLKGNVPQIDIDEAIGVLKKTLIEWKRMSGLSIPVQEKDYLNTDRLVELGLGKVVLGCFFSGLPNGMDSLVEELMKDPSDSVMVELGAFWMPREISTKYRVIRDQLEKSLAWRTNEEGILGREKVIVISPARKQGRTGDVLQREVSDGNGSKTHLYKGEDLDRINDTKLIDLIRVWVQNSGLCNREDVLLLDGSITGSKRESVITRFTNDPQAAVLVTTLEAASQGRDFTLNTIVDKYGRRIVGVHNLLIGQTWDSRQRRQIIGRSVRQERLIPVRSTVMEILDSVEQGKGEVVRFTSLLDAIVLSGATLHPNDQEFFDSKRVGTRVLRYRDPDSHFLRDVFRDVKGKEPEAIQDFFRRKEKGQEKTNAQRVAEKFYDCGRDAYKTTGYNAEMVASMVNKFGLDNGQMLSLGAGTLLIQRKLKRGIDNVDYNQYMMDEGWREAQAFGGRRIVADAARLDAEQFPNETYDFVDSAFALDWAALGNIDANLVDKSVRVQVLLEINRVLKTGGSLSLTLPEKTLDDEHLNLLIGALETYFGFKVDRSHSGKSYGISKFGTTKRLGWCVVAQKINNPNLNNFNLRNIEFCIDNREWVSNFASQQDGGSGPVREDPAPDLKLDFEHYKIVGLTGEETEVNVSDEDVNIPVDSVDLDKNTNTEEKGSLENIPTEDIGRIDLSFLRGETREEFQSYKKDLLRPLTKITGLNWTEAEEYGINLLQDIVKRSKSPRSRIIAYSWIIEETKRRMKGNR